MGDVAQILSVSGMPSAPSVSSLNRSTSVSPIPSSTHHAPNSQPKGGRLTGMAREVMDLLGSGQGSSAKGSGSLPPMIPSSKLRVNQHASSKSSDKPVKVARKWVWAPFSSSSRTDGLTLRHWVKSGVEYPDYPYARFDVHMDPVVYTEEEYEKYLQDPTWTKSESDKLMALSRRLELRWPIIHDRWCSSLGVPPFACRKVEELQHRYYKIASILGQLKLQEAASMEASKSNGSLSASHLAKQQPPIHNIGTGTSTVETFSLSKELDRKHKLDKSYSRTREDEREEAGLRRELTMIEAQLRKLKKMGGHLVGSNPTLPSAPLPVNTHNNIESLTANSKILFDQALASTAPVPSPGIPYLQSSRLATPATGPMGLNKTLIKKMDAILKELKVNERPMPTKRVCDLYDAVRKSTLTLLTLQKIALKKEGNVLIKKNRLTKQTSPQTVSVTVKHPKPTTTNPTNPLNINNTSYTKPKPTKKKKTNPGTSGGTVPKSVSSEADGGALSKKSQKRKLKKSSSSNANIAAAFVAAAGAVATSSADAQMKAAPAVAVAAGAPVMNVGFIGGGGEKGREDERSVVKKRARKS